MPLKAKTKCPNCGKIVDYEIILFGDPLPPEMLADKNMAEQFKHHTWTTEPPTDWGWYWVMIPRNKIAPWVEMEIWFFDGENWKHSVFEDIAITINKNAPMAIIGPLPYPNPLDIADKGKADTTT